MKKLLHITSGEASERIFSRASIAALEEFGGLEIVENGIELTDRQRATRIRDYPVLLTGWGSAKAPACLAEDPGKLKYICNLTGSVTPFVPLELIEAGVRVTNWGDNNANEVAEGAMSLLLAKRKGMH